MSRRRRQQQQDTTDSNHEVRGPSSALTSFLREQGINAEAIRLRYEETLRQQAEQGTSILYEGDEETEEIRAIRQRASIKRSRANNDIDDDEAEINEDDGEGKNYCIECDKEFVVSVYSKKMENYGRIGYLCGDCTAIQIKKDRLSRANEIEARKRRKKVAAALLDREEYKLPSLQDCCIQIISKNIDDVELLGDIGVANSKKISRILSKNRSLDSKTMTLFLDPSLKEIEFWDCSNISSDALTQLAANCPLLESITLNLCGRLHNDNLLYYSDKLKNLQHLNLNGPFLINDSMWQGFFDSDVGRNLKGFHLRNTHRFMPDSLIALLDNCGNNLEYLTLSRLDGLTTKTAYDLLPHYLQKLKHLEISYPNKEELIDDDLIVSLLSINGETLETLILDGCSGLSDQFLIGGIRPFCPSLTKLSTVLLDQITDEGMTQLFTNWEINGGLMDINLSRCIEIGDDGAYAMLEHSGQTLVELSLNSVKLLTKKFFTRLSRNLRFPLLTALDIGFVRSCDDSVLAILSRIAPKLSILEIYGDNRCTHKAIVRSDLRVIGRQSDSI
ncbi:hypothetical protein CANARDRAFT_201121 [[Candida] arabinofermentans NRRL YB-2248]|uniref:DNA repair protein rhp7 treble clef domain-containing protein n=1 Tax=[Candida] arabinofermentans NRRL YB-2248 TaxID=983967 RepID=A0A1E4SXZ7_9ASCO|nr:hypothetical protein CANARDRAFT_201121 [[Candida] arabinofermentans NRRL YB-2248]